MGTHQHDNHKSTPARARILGWVVIVVLLAGLGYFLWMEHRAHTINAAPWVLFLVVHLLMHRGHHHGHGGHGHHRNHREGDSSEGDHES